MKKLANDYNFKSINFGPLEGGGLVRSKHQSTRDDAGKNEIDSNEELEHQQKVFNHYA